MSHIGTDDETWAWGGSPEGAIQRMLKPDKKKPAKVNMVSTMRTAFLKLDKQLKEFGKDKCKFHKSRKKDPSKWLDCNHSAMGYGGMSRNTDCELENCPRILYGDEG